MRKYWVKSIIVLLAIIHMITLIAVQFTVSSISFKTPYLTFKWVDRWKNIVLEVSMFFGNYRQVSNISRTVVGN